MTIKAIETYYNGYRFRSRLEARWAVFFDTAGIEYQYEPEGIETESGEKYLPDFYLPELETHVEVKGKKPGFEKEILRLQQFVEWGGPIKQILILSDVPGKTNDGGIWHFPAYYYRALGVSRGWFFFQDSGDDVIGHISRANYYLPNISEWDIERGRFSIDPKSDYEKGMKNISDCDDFCFSAWEINDQTANAFLTARQARFEHGETPAVNRE